MHETSVDGRAQHLAVLYGSDDFIIDRVASFVAEGLAGGELVLVVCTVPHWSLLARRLESGAVPYGRATGDRRLVFVDAQEVLDTISENGSVSETRFGEMLAPLLPAGAKTRIYGEVVSLLAARGDIDAAIRIERLGHELAHTRGISILCGYQSNATHPLSDAATAQVLQLHDRTSVQLDPP